jgi:hypothetical protein
MVGQKAHAALARATLPSLTLAALAEQVGLGVDALGDFIEADMLVCCVLLHDQTGVIPKEPIEHLGGRGDYRPPWTEYPEPEQVPLNGHFRLPTRWAAAAFDGRIRTAPSVLAFVGGTSRLVTVPGFYPMRRDLRVERGEVERFQRDVLSHQFVSSIQTAPAVRRSALDQERCKAVAGYMWSKDPEATIVDMAKSQGIQKFALEGRQYRDETIHRWIREFCPNRRPGRRKSS